MSNCIVNIDGYKDEYSHLNGQLKMQITKYDIAVGMISIGKTHWSEYVTKKNLMDIIHYWTALIPYIDEKPTLKINENFIKLDPSDKTGKSYVIGTGVTNVIASKILKISCLQYAEELRKVGIIKVNSGSLELGDLVGIDTNGDWHVMESKGRTYPVSNTLKKKAKRQAEKIEKINGLAPKTKNYCITYINNDACLFTLSDPDKISDNPVNLEIDIDAFLRFYYKRIFGSFLMRSSNITLIINNLLFQAFRVDLDGEGIYLGLENRIFEACKLKTISRYYHSNKKYGKAR